MTKTIAILATEGVQLLDVAGPMDVFAEANVQTRNEVYRLRLVAPSVRAIRSSSGIRLMPDATVLDSPHDIHTLLVAGGPNIADQTPSKAVLDWLKVAVKCPRYGSVCTGAFLLASAGLIERRRVTTHWAVAKQLASRFPKVQVEEDAIYIRDGRLRTAAGVTAGLDLALALVEEDHGRDIAMRVAAQLVMYFKRSGGQRQFSRSGEIQLTGRSALQELQRYVCANLTEDHRVALLAERLNLSSRHLTRLFRSELGMTPAAWVLAARLSSARRLLESGRHTPKEAAMKCGFPDANTMRRAFVREFGVSPAEYSRSYASAIND